jgi:D-aspartate ligase
MRKNVSDNNRKAIIFGSYINALSLIRALGRQGIYVIVVDHIRNIGSSSKYINEFALAPDPYIEQEEFLNYLLLKAPQWNGAILIPTDDFQVAILSKEMKKLSEFYIVAVPSYDVVQTVVDKTLSYKLALELDIPTPQTFFPRNTEDLSKLSNTISYPCILKPIEGHLFKKQHSTKIIKIDSVSMLYSEFKKEHDKYPLMIQEIIEGKDSNIILYAAYYDLKGEPLAEFTGQKIRQTPPFFGNARVAKSITNNEIIDYSRKMLNKLNYSGSLVGVEFKYDNKDSKLKFIEINARSVMWYSLIEASGMNLPFIMYQDRVIGRKIRQNSYKKNIYWIHESVDIRYMIRRPKNENLSFREYLKPYLSKKTFALFARDDWKPSINTFYSLFRSMFKNLFKRIKRRG